MYTSRCITIEIHIFPQKSQERKGSVHKGDCTQPLPLQNWNSVPCINLMKKSPARTVGTLLQFGASLVSCGLWHDIPRQPRAHRLVSSKKALLWQGMARRKQQETDEPNTTILTARKVSHCGASQLWKEFDTNLVQFDSLHLEQSKSILGCAIV